MVRRIMHACADCDTCRFLMHEDCHFFPELYRLVDREADTGQSVHPPALRRLLDRCTLCGMCPCPNIRNDVIEAKRAYVRRDGIPLTDRLLADPQWFGRTCARLPGALRSLLPRPIVQKLIKRLAGVHPQRELPVIPDTPFFAWAHDRGLGHIPGSGPTVAYFAGCTAGYLFPEVGRAAVKVLEHHGVKVCVPPQQCCGMPTLVEGLEQKTLGRTAANLKMLRALQARGIVPVTACPTCGFLMKTLLAEGAHRSHAYQRSVGAGEDDIKIPDPGCRGRFIHLNKALYGNRMTDDGLFRNLDPLDRIALSDGVRDVGAYLAERHAVGRQPEPVFGSMAARMVYFAPCHQREQNIGSPYRRLLGLIPQLRLEPVGGPMDCCGMGGSLGFKHRFHDLAVAQGKAVAAKITAADPEGVVTDCLSCRIQFAHLLPYPIFHPLEILAQACDLAPVSP